MASLPVLVLALVLVPSACSVVAQEIPSVSVVPSQQGIKQPEQLKGHITGTVFCSDTHRPARGAMILISPIPSDTAGRSAGGTTAMTRVALDGTYSADHVASGEYVVIAFLPGYVSPMDELLAGEMNPDSAHMREKLAEYGSVSVRGEGTARFDVTLERGAAVSGHVLYSDGSPATQVSIDVEDTRAKPAASNKPEDNINVGMVSRMLFTHQSSGTDDQGRFRIAGLRPGKYRVAAVQANAGSSKAQEKEWA